MRTGRLIVAVAAAASAACGAFSSNDVPADGDAGASSPDGSAAASVDGGGDGPTDAAIGSSSDSGDDGSQPGPPCTPHAPITLLAGDFDNISNGSVYSVMGTTYSIPPNTAGASAGVMIPGAGGTTRSLHIHSTGDKYVLEAPPNDLAGGVCVVTSAFDIKFDGINVPGAGDVTFAIVGVRNPAFDHCYVYFQYFKAQNRLGLQSHCGERDGGGDYNAYTMPVPAFPAGFVHVVLTLDLSKAAASLLVGSTMVNLALQTNQVVVGGPQAYAEIGLDGTGLDGTIDVDTIDVEAR